MTNRSLLPASVIIFLATLFCPGCENDPVVIKNLTKDVLEKEEAFNIESYLSQDGVMKAKLTAPYMVRVAKDTVYVEFPRSLHVDFYDDSTKKESWLSSKYGKYYENLNKVYLRDSVVVINVKGDTLKAADLWWDQNKKLFYTEKYAEYRTLDKKIYPTKGIEATQDFSRITFRDLSGQVKVKDEGFPED